MDVRQITDSADLRIIRDIAGRVWPETFAAILSPEQIAYMMKMMYAPEVLAAELARGYIFEVLHIDGVPAGYAVHSRYEARPDTAKLHKIYLLGEYQGRGLGSRLLNHVIRRSSEAGYRHLRLNVNKENAKAQKAYLRNGFTVVEAVKIDIGNGFVMDDFVMEKVL
ncbi:MAG: N-acetyltransferase family protein [Victivallaceae bacterium]